MWAELPEKSERELLWARELAQAWHDDAKEAWPQWVPDALRTPLSAADRPLLAAEVAAGRDAMQAVEAAAAAAARAAGTQPSAAGATALDAQARAQRAEQRAEQRATRRQTAPEGATAPASKRTRIDAE